jgi:3-oxoacyl-[acyl-carrier-protein] synthase-3
MHNSTISACVHIFPEKVLPSTDLEALIGQNSLYTPTQGIIEATTGIRERHVSRDDEFNSSLAIEACQMLFSSHNNITPSDIDLLIFASAGQDMLEPATAHIVQDSIGTRCPVLDVTNACNSFINALEIADAFIKAGRYQRILIATGEVSTKSAKLVIENKDDFKKSFPGYTFGDIGTAVVVEKSADPAVGILDMCFTADSTHWGDAMLAGGGSRFQNEGGLYFQGSGNELKIAFESIGPEFIRKFLQRNHLNIGDVKHVFIHQVSVPYLQSFMDTCGLTKDQVEETVSTCGNVAAGSLPLAWSLRAGRGELKSGDFVLLVGLAGGISLGTILLRV